MDVQRRKWLVFHPIHFAAFGLHAVYGRNGDPIVISIRGFLIFDDM